MKLVVATVVAPTKFIILPNLGRLNPTRIIAKHTTVRKIHLLKDNLPVKVNQGRRKRKQGSKKRKQDAKEERKQMYVSYTG